MLSHIRLVRPRRGLGARAESVKIIFVGAKATTSSILLTLLFGCETEIVFVPLPEAEGVRSQIVFAEHTDFIEARAGEWGARVQLEIEPQVIGIAAYDETLDTLGVSAGVVEAGQRCARTCELLTPKMIFFRELDGTDWQTEPDLRPEWADVLLPDRVDRCTACVELKARTVLIPAPQDIEIRFAVTEPSGAVLIGRTEGEIYRIALDGGVEIVCRERPGPPIFAGVLAEADALWVSGARDLQRIVLSEQDPSAPCVTDSSTATHFFADRRIARMAAAPIGEDFEILLASEGGEFVRFDGERFERLAMLEVPEVTNRAAAVWLGPGRYAFAAGTEELVRINNGSVEVETLLIDQQVPRIDGAAFVPELGLVLALGEDGLALEDELGWYLERIRGWTSPGFVVPYRKGVLFTTANGGFGQYHAGEPDCGLSVGVTTERVFHAAALGDKDAVLADVTTGDQKPSAIGLVTAEPPVCE